MATFIYNGFDSQGKAVKGTLDVDSKEAALTQIKSEGIMVTSITEGSALNKDLNISIFNKKPTTRDLSVFCRQFVSIINAGVTVTAALEMLVDQTENKMLAEALAYSKTSIQQGTTFSEAMKSYPKVFSDLFITMVEAGEASGNLDVSFSRMATQFEKDSKIQGMIKKAAVYPIVILIVATVAVGVLLVMVIPTFEQMLSDLGTEMPALTVAVLAASEFMQDYWYIVLGAIAVIFLFFRNFMSTEAGQYTIGRLALKLPLIGNLSIKSASSRFSRTLSTLMAAGVPLMDSLEISSRVMSNALFKDAVLTARDDVGMGSPLAEPLKRTERFPTLVHHMVKVGEEVGDLEGMLEKLADYYDEEVEDATASIMAAMEPAIIVVLAAIIGTIVIAVVLPMASMYEGLGNL